MPIGLVAGPVAVIAAVVRRIVVAASVGHAVIGAARADRIADVRRRRDARFAK